jgi:hypothetical protein
MKLKNLMLFKLYKLYYNFKCSRIKCPVKPNIGRRFFNGRNIFDTFVYKDETWNYVKNIDKLFKYSSHFNKVNIDDNHCLNDNKISLIGNNSFIINSTNIKNEDWIYLYSKDLFPPNYSLEFSTIIYSVFTEFQIAFRHISIQQRYRFRVVDNEYLTFEIINNGFFFNNVLTIPFTFILKKEYTIRIEVFDNSYSFFVNNELLLGVKEKYIKSIYGGGLAFIFWDNKELSNIKLKIENIRFNKLYF